MRWGQEPDGWAKELNEASEALRRALFEAAGGAAQNADLFAAIDRFVTAKINCMKRERY